MPDSPTLISQCAIALGGKVIGGQIICPGPDHSAKDESLSVKLDPTAKDGFIVHSFSGDDFAECKEHVKAKLKAAGLDLTPNPVEYVYRGPDGKRSRKVVRGPGKQFPQYHWTGIDWKPGVSEIPAYPYRLPELIASTASVFLCEGEKDADRVASLGLTATTNSGGASSWKPELNEWFKDRDVYILEDNDDAGRKRCQDISKQLKDVAKSIRIVTFKELPEKSDVSDWLDADSSRGASELLAYAESFPLWTEADCSGVKLISPGDYMEQAANQAFVIQGLIASGCLSSINGRPGKGKTALAVHMAKHLTDGTPFLGRNTTPSHVLYIATEDAGDVARRAFAIEADEILIPTGHDFGLMKPDETATILKEQIGLLQKKAPAKPVVIIYDTLRSGLGGKSVIDDSKTSPGLQALRKVAEERGAAIIVCNHTNRADPKASKGETLESIVGTELILADDDGRTMIEVGKNRYGPGYRVIGQCSFTSVTVQGMAASIVSNLEVADDETHQLNLSLSQAWKQVGANQKLLSEVLQDCLHAGFEFTTADGEIVKAAGLEEIRKAFYAKKVGENATKQKAFVRALKLLTGTLVKETIFDGKAVVHSVKPLPSSKEEMAAKL
jgi:5S rRNA maturation endonuclease (ribonuclease M5)